MEMIIDDSEKTTEQAINEYSSHEAFSNNSLPLTKAQIAQRIEQLYSAKQLVKSNQNLAPNRVEEFSKISDLTADSVADVTNQSLGLERNFALTPCKGGYRVWSPVLRKYFKLSSTITLVALSFASSEIYLRRA